MLVLYLFFWIGFICDVSAVPVGPWTLDRLHRRADNSSFGPFSLPASYDKGSIRAKAIVEKQQNFLYGPSPAGGSSFFPAGPLGNATVYNQAIQDGALLLAVGQAVADDEAKALTAIEQIGGLKSLSDYNVLYEGQWTHSVPEGVDSGMLSNYTDDLLFSMERLSVNPYSISRLQAPEDGLPFKVEDTIVLGLTGVSLEELYVRGHLFYANHRSQATLNRTTRYTAACDAYFYIHPKSRDFLPLAVRPNMGSELIYTPLDRPNDWLLAKIMFNNNDFWYSQWYHFAGTHSVVEIVNEAGIRTLSDDHPVLAIINRIGYRAFAYRIDFAARLVNPGGPIDSLFSFSATAAVQFTSELYSSGLAGSFHANYFYTDLVARGLHNPNSGPAFKYFPFFEDASVIHRALKDFMIKFVNSYYSCDDDLLADPELQSFIAEAIPAQIIDFPSAPLAFRTTLIDILTHLAFLTTAVHHTLNTNDLAESSATLPFHPASLYAPTPLSKGISDAELLAFLPPAGAAVAQIALAAFFAQPSIAGTNQTLASMWDDPMLLGRMNAATDSAAQEFRHAMNKFSRSVSERKFDNNGLSQGMPFLWKALDLEVAPFYLAI